MQSGNDPYLGLYSLTVKTVDQQTRNKTRKCDLFYFFCILYRLYIFDHEH